MNTTSNWKTTLAGVLFGSAGIITALWTAFSAGQFKGENLVEIIFSAGLIVIGCLASDGVLSSVLQNSVLKSVEPVAQEIVGLESAAHPTNVLLNDVKQILTTVAANTTPAAAAPAPAPAASPAKA